MCDLRKQNPYFSYPPCRLPPLQKVMDSDPPSHSPPPESLVGYGTATSAIVLALKVLSLRVLLVQDCRKVYGTMLLNLIGERGVHGSILMAILDMVCGWRERDMHKGGVITLKDMHAFLSTFTLADRSGCSPSMAEEYEDKYLRLLHTMCSDPR